MAKCILINTFCHSLNQKWTIKDHPFLIQICSCHLLYYKSEKPSVCLSVCIPFDVTHCTLEPLRVSKRLWRHGSALNNDAFEKFERAIVSRLRAVEGRCVD